MMWRLEEAVSRRSASTPSNVTLQKRRFRDVSPVRLLTALSPSSVNLDSPSNFISTLTTAGRAAPAATIMVGRPRRQRQPCHQSIMAVPPPFGQYRELRERRPGGSPHVHELECGELEVVQHPACTGVSTKSSSAKDGVHGIKCGVTDSSWRSGLEAREM
jgi:hypothetical protein